MFVFDNIKMSRPVGAAVLPCQRFPKIGVRVVDCTSHRGIAGVRVDIGCDNRQALETCFSAEVDQFPTFTLAQKSYHIYTDASATTDKDGWACFPIAAIARSKGDFMIGGGYAVRVILPDYRLAGIDAPDDAPETLKARFAVEMDQHRIVTATIRSERPKIPADLKATVDKLFANVDRIRLLVEQAPNMGNQSAALSLLRNLRALGYGKQIEVLAAPRDNMVELRWTFDVSARLATPFADDDARDIQGQKTVAAMAHCRNTPFNALRNQLAGAEGELVEKNGVWSGAIHCRYPALDYFVLTPEHMAAITPDFPYTLKVSPGLGADQDLVFSNPNVALNPRIHIFPLAFQLTVTIVSRADPAVTTKLRTLDPQYKTNPVYGTAENTSWIEADEFDASLLEEKETIGMIAAHDLGLGTIQEYRKLNCKTYSILALQPLLWHEENRYCATATTAATPLCLPRSAAYFIEPEVVAAGAMREFAIANTISAGQADVLAAIVRKAEARELTLMTAYGIHQAHDSTTECVLQNLVSAALAAQAKGGFPRKVVIFVVCKTSLEEIPLHVNGSLVQLAAQNALAELNQLADGHVLVVQSAPIANVVFQRMAQASTLPVILEGANTSNTMQMLGKPYLSVSTKTTQYVTLPEHGQPGHSSLDAVTTALNKGPVDIVANYFHTVATTGDAYGGYFAALKAYVRHASQDQLMLGLYRLEKALRPDAPVPIPSSCGGRIVE